MLINKLEDESKKNSMKNLRHSSTASDEAIDKKGNRHEILDTGSDEPVSRTGRTNERIAEMAGTT